MQLSPVAPYGVTRNTLAKQPGNNPPAFGVNGHPGKGLALGHRNQSAVQLSSEYYSSTNVDMTYTNSDGDTVSLSVEHVEYQRAMMTAAGNSDSEAWKEIVKSIREEFEQMQAEMVEKFLSRLTGEEPNKVKKSTGTEGIPGLPEYWNAENTSQRIVDFALSFAGIHEGSDKEFFNLIKGAIEEGFSLARKEMGELPEEVGKLVNDTYALVMEKLDAWAAGQGIEVKGAVEGEQTAA